MGMFDSIECNYPLPLPLEVIDVLPDIYETEFQTKDLENALELYFLNEDGTLSERRRQYKWKDDDSAFFKGYMDVVSEEIAPSDFHGILNFYCYETIYTSEDMLAGIDVSIDYIAKFTNGKIENIEILSFEVRDAGDRLIRLKETLDGFDNERKKWYNKYLFNTKLIRFFRSKIIRYLYNIHTFTGKLHSWAIRYI